MGQDLQDLAPQIEIPEPFHDLSKLSHSVICQAWVVLLPLTFEGHMYCIPVVAHSGTWLSHEIMLCTIVIRNIKPTSCHWKKWEILRKVRKVFIGSFFFFFCFCNYHFPENKKQWQKQHQSGISKAQDFWTTRKTQACQHAGQCSPPNSCQNS